MERVILKRGKSTIMVIDKDVEFYERHGFVKESKPKPKRTATRKKTESDGE